MVHQSGQQPGTAYASRPWSSVSLIGAEPILLGGHETEIQPTGEA
jgi:hypothetical protein